MRLIRRVVFAILLLLAASAVWGGVYAQRRGFSKTWREMVENEFSNRGYYVDIGRLTLGPFQGLVAEDVRFFNDPQKRREMAFVDNVILDLDLTDVLNRDLAINTLDVKDAKLTLPVTPGRRDSELLKVDRFSARLVVTENQIEVVRAQATVAGIDVSLKGTLFRPKRNVTPPQGEVTQVEIDEQRLRLLEIRRRLDRVHTVLKQVEQIAFPPGEPPRLEISFAGDLADLAHLDAEGRLTAENVRRGSYAVQRISVAAAFNGSQQRAVLKEFHLRDNAGDLRLQGGWTLADRSIEFKMESDSDLLALAASIRPSPKFGEVVFFTPPRVHLEGSVNVDALKRYPPNLRDGPAWFHLPFQVQGTIRCDRFGSRGSVFDGMEAQFAIQGPRSYVRNLRLDHKSGVLFANFMYDPARESDKLRFQTEIKLDPRVFGPFLPSESVQRFVSTWHFGSESTVYLAGLGSGSTLDPATWSSKGVIDLRKFRYNNVPFELFESEYEADSGRQLFKNLAAKRPEGEITAGELEHSAKFGYWETEALRSNLDLHAFIGAVAPGWSSLAKRYRFSQPPESSLTGRVCYSEAGPGHDFKIQFGSDQPATFDFLGRPLPLRNLSGSLEARGSGWKVTAFDAAAFGGEISGTFDGAALEPGSAYEAMIGASGVAFDDLLHLYGDTERRGGGTVSGELSVTGSWGEPRSMAGTGRAELRDGNLMAIPLFAPAFDTIGKLLGDAAIPTEATGTHIGMGGSATLKMTGGILSATHLRATTDRFELKGYIEVDRSERTFAGELDAGLLSGNGPRLTLVGEGSPDAPKWRVRLPRVP